MNHDTLWAIALKTLVLFTIIGGVLFLSSCASRNCTDVEWLGNSSNNKIENLRGCDQTVNCLNRNILTVSNKTGHQGISYDKSRGKFRASCMNKTLGRFDTIKEAIATYEKYRQRVYEERIL